MANKFFDKVYHAKGDTEMQALYDEWADVYDADVLKSGYVTPSRVADALLRLGVGENSPILDFGCGTGLSGEALSRAGFTVLDGTDLSEGMLQVARGRGMYRNLWTMQPDEALKVEPGSYAAVAAVGVIGAGGAPARVINDILKILLPGNLLVFSMNDQTRSMQEYTEPLEKAVATGEVEIVFDEYGPHLSKHGENTGATVYGLKRLG